MKATDLDLARLALSKGWITADRHDRALAEADRYQALGLDKAVDEILVDDGSLTGEQLRALREALGWTLKRPRIGGYEIVRRVGLGGMGTVFEARHVRLQKRIALKVLFPRLARDPRFTERFLREARALARLDHPHLVHAMDAGQDGEHFFLAMEFIEGENLLQLIARQGPVQPRRSVEIVRDVCDALGALEERGLIHRDIKPANVLIGADGVVKLADLGLLKGMESPGDAREETVCGTPHYISPEQIERREDVDIRADLYSLGATWYHLVVGRPPFVGVRTAEVLEAHREKEPPLPSRLRPGVPAGVERVILQWLSKEREARPASTKAAIAELDRLAASLGKGRWKSFAARLISFPRAGKRGILAGALLLVLAAGTLATLALLVPPTGKDLRVDEEPAPVPALVTPPPADAQASPAHPIASVQDPPAPPAGPDAALPAEIAREPEAPSMPPEPAAGPLSPLPATGEAPPSVFTALHGRTARLGEQLAASWGGLHARAARFEDLHRFSRSFHASFVGIEPDRSPPARITLRYSFDSEGETDDFRAMPGSWDVRDGVLHGLMGPAGEPLESVAWFVPPLRIEWELPRGCPFIIGMGSLRVAPGRGTDGRIWSEASGSQVPVLAAPATPAGRGVVRISRGRVEILAGGVTASIDAHVPESGRISVRIASHQSISMLALEGTLEPTWSASRLRYIRESR